MRIAIFSPVAYDFLTQRPHQLAKAFAELGHEVMFVEPVENVIATSIRRLLGISEYRFENARHAGVGVLRVPRFALPELNVPLLPMNATSGKVREYILRRLHGFLHGGQTTVAIIENPIQIEYIPVDAFDVVCYDCIDDFSVISGDTVGRNEHFLDEILEKAHVAFVTAGRLESEINRRKNNSIPIVRIPNGVDYDWFVHRSKNPETLLTRYDRPIVGYVGALFQWVDVDWIIELARRKHDHVIMLVGPASQDVRKKLSSASENIVTVGEVPYDLIPLYIRSFSVGIIPFRTGSVAETTDPIKLYEYFALGKPVVAAGMPQLDTYQRRGLLRIVLNADEGAQAIDELTMGDTAERRIQRQRIAEEHSWKFLAQRMVEAMTADTEKRHNA